MNFLLELSDVSARRLNNVNIVVFVGLVTLTGADLSQEPLDSGRHVTSVGQVSRNTTNWGLNVEEMRSSMRLKFFRVTMRS